MARLALSFLGQWQVTLDAQVVTGFESSKVRALLSYLAIEKERPHYREALAGLFWPTVPEQAALASLRQALANLRKTIRDADAEPPCLLVARTTIQFNRASDVTLDVDEFSALVARCDRHSHRRLDCCPACAGRLQQAADLYCGAFLADLYINGTTEFETWALIQRERLQQLAQTALGHLAGYYERRAAFDIAQRTLARQIELEPWDEEAYRGLMRVLARSGRRSAALAQYQTCRRLLHEELGVAPAAETVALSEQIQRGALAKDGPGAALLNWPHAPMPLIGRDAELAELAAIIANRNCRLLTILGPGGMGKTRLALEAAAAAAWSFTRGAAFVPLASLHTAEYLAPAIAQALGLTLSGPAEPRKQLIHELRDWEILIVLDGFEHVRAGTSLLSELLARAPHVLLLVTSRERLDLTGEWLFELGGLRYPATDNAEPNLGAYSAVQLFTHSARRARATFALAQEDGRDVARICRMVEGMPLAIELAAAWVRVISCAEIAVELERGLDLLSTARRDLAARHRSLRAVFDHSWHLLTPEEQSAFRCLSVFRGGFERAAAEQVAGVALPVLSTLVDKTLVRWEEQAQRYGMHELIAEYAREQLRASGDERSVNARHAAYMLQFAERSEPELRGPQQRSWLNWLDAERDNLRAVLDWCLASGNGRDLETGLRIAHALAGFWWMRGLSEGRNWLAALLQHPQATARSPARAKALTLTGDLAIEQEGNYAMARAMYAESLAISTELGDRHGAAATLLGLGAVARAGGDVAGARALHEQSLALWQELDEKWGIAWALHELGDVAFEQAELDSARSLYQRALAIRREIGDKSGVAWLLSMLGEVARYEGDYERARTLYHESLGLHRQVGNRHGEMAVITNLGYATLDQGHRRQARALFEESLSLNAGNKGVKALCLVGLAGAAQPAERAVQLLAAAEPFRDVSSTPADRADYARIAARARAQLDEATFARAWQTGRGLTLNEAIALAQQEGR